MFQDSALITSALLAFFSTTMDDFAVMLIFFGRVNIEMPDQLKLGYLKVMIGQTIGFSILVFISFIGLLIGTIVPTEYIDIIGLFPLIAGFLNFHELSKEEGWYELKCLKPKDSVNVVVELSLDKKTNSVDSLYSVVPVSDEEGPKNIEITSISNPLNEIVKNNSKDDKSHNYIINNEEEGFRDTPTDIIKNELDELDTYETINFQDEIKEVDEEDEEESNYLSGKFKQYFSSCLDPLVLEVTAYALVCGSDNIAIYISIFASLDILEVLFVVFLFYLCLAFNIICALGLMKVPKISCFFTENSKYIVPFMLMGLGLFIIQDSLLWPSNCPIVLAFLRTKVAPARLQDVSTNLFLNKILDEDAISDDDTKSSSIPDVVKAIPLKKKVPKPLPPNYVCGACGAKDVHAIYDCPSKHKKTKTTTAIDSKEPAPKKENKLEDHKRKARIVIFMSGLPFSMTREKLLEYLDEEKCGEDVIDIKLLKFEDNPNKCKGVAFLTLKNENSVDKILELNGKEMNNKKLVVQRNSKEQEEIDKIAQQRLERIEHQKRLQKSNKKAGGPRCFRCGESHDPSSCTNPRICYRCKSVDHISSECPNKKR